MKGDRRILIIDDERALQRVLVVSLRRHGYDVDAVSSGGEALAVLSERSPDLILLDLGLPDIDGLALLHEIRRRSSAPVLVLTVRDAQQVKVAALDLGADDYLTKPFSLAELLARIRALLRRTARSAEASSVLQVGDILFDAESGLVTVQGRSARLTPTEAALLRAFLAAPNRVLAPAHLLTRIWGPDYCGDDHLLHVYIARLRKKIEPDPQQPVYLVTEPGYGYRLVPTGACAQDDVSR
ncbi:MAG: response regulator transcription factor [Thermomicrobium sp.]|nr:response regulator transcription factor [Thermomicrobium sp.]MDW8007801.1 response regulator transcription factor [Thermomicrobium sp.]